MESGIHGLNVCLAGAEAASGSGQRANPETSSRGRCCLHSKMLRPVKEAWMVLGSARNRSVNLSDEVDDDRCPAESLYIGALVAALP